MSRPDLTRDRVLDAALEIADAEGLGPLSMRRIAESLGVGVMSLYNHIEHKKDVVAGITDRVAADFALPDGSDWRMALRHSAISAHGVLLRHPWACATMSGGPLGPARLRFYDALLGTMRVAGCSTAVARRGFIAIDAHVLGFAQQEATLPPEPPARAELARAFLATLAKADTPHMYEMVANLLESGDYDYGFTYLLDLILDDIQRQTSPSLANEL